MIFARRPLLLVPLLLAAVLPGLPNRAAAAGFPDITPEERALTSVPGEPNAPAVVLFKRGEFSMAGVLGNSESSALTVRIRRKILTEEGKRYGEVMIHHSKWARLQNLKGRTVLADGRVVPLPKDAVFRRKTSDTGNLYVTSVAFPGVEVGAILDYSYEVRIDTIFLLEPWFFQEEVPTLYSEMICEMPEGVITSTWRRDPMRAGIQQEIKQTVGGVQVKVWGKNLPAVPTEPYSLPFADIASSFILIPTGVQDGYGSGTDLFKSWPSTCGFFAKDYDKALRKSGDAGRKAKEIAAQAGAAPGDKARALYRFVRDEIENDDAGWIALADKVTADSVLAARRGDSTEKAVLLQAMLKAVQIDAQPVWVADRSGGAIDLQLASPFWFDRAIVAAQIDGQRVFLDPADDSLAFGHLEPGLEGTPALLFDGKKPETVTLPASPFTDHTRQAKMELEIGADGRVTGHGAMTFTGHHAWSALDPKEDAAKVTKTWQDRLAEDWKGYDVKEVQVKQSVDDQRFEVTWTLAQREEEALGDETTLQPSVPLGPTHQPFTASAATRVSPVLLGFADRDDLELSLRWPEGWKPETLPRPVTYRGGAGGMTATVEVNDAERTLRYHRVLDVKEKLLNGPQLYQEIKILFDVAEKHDAQALVLARR